MLKWVLGCTDIPSQQYFESNTFSFNFKCDKSSLEIGPWFSNNRLIQERNANDCYWEIPYEIIIGSCKIPLGELSEELAEVKQPDGGSGLVSPYIGYQYDNLVKS